MDNLSAQPASVRTRRLILAWVVFLIAVAAILYVPYFVPQKPSASYSWLFGFNNRVAVLLTLLFAAAAAIWAPADLFRLDAGGSREPLPRWTLWLTLVLVACVCGGMYLLIGGLPGWNEAPFSIHRAWLLSQGKRPYVDFQWTFGIAQIAVPLLLHRLFSLSFAHAEYLYFVLTAFAGVTFLYATIARIDYPARHVKTMYLLLFAATLPGLLSAGTQYTLLRYTAPLFCSLWVFDEGRKAHTHVAWMRVIGFAWIAAVVLFLISPEAAAAFVFSAIILLFPRRLQGWPRPSAWQYAILATGLLAICVTALRLHALDTALSDSAAEAFPVVLSAFSVFFFWQIALCSVLGYRFWRGRQPVNNTVALVVPCILLLTAAMGRADPGHLFSNTIGLAIASFAYTSTSKWLWRGYLTAFVLLWIIVTSPFAVKVALLAAREDVIETAPQTGLPGLVHPAVVALIYRVFDRLPPATRAKQTQLLERYAAYPLPRHIDFAAVYPGVAMGPDGILEAPFGYGPYSTNSSYYLSTQIDYGFYKGQETAHSVSAIQRHIDELKAHPGRDLLLPADTIGTCRYFDVAGAQKDLSSLNLSRYRARAAHVDNPTWSLCDYIQTHYTLAAAAAPRNWDYELWQPKP